MAFDSPQQQVALAPAPRARPRQVRAPAVKSSERTLHILELFDTLRGEASAATVARSLGYPLSSTSSLLRTLRASGYLIYDPVRRVYQPSARVALLGHWTTPWLLKDGDLLDAMRALSAEIGGPVTLSIRSGLYARVIHRVGDGAAAPDDIQPLAGCATGFALMSRMSDIEATRMILRAKIETPCPGVSRPLSQLVGLVATARADGHVLDTPAHTPGLGAVAGFLPTGSPHFPMALTLCGDARTLAERRCELGRRLTAIAAGLA